MKVTKAQAEANRARIVEAAATLFRERGYDGVSVADLMAAAGFTHGGFYKHFGSKADLIAETACNGLAQTAQQSRTVNTRDFVTKYLSREHRDHPGEGCTMAALCSDAARQQGPVKEAFADGIENLLAILSAEDGCLSECELVEARARHLTTIAQVIGAVTLSRACPDDSALADEILAVCRARLLDEPGGR